MTRRSYLARVAKLEAGGPTAIVPHLFVGSDARELERAARASGIIGRGPVLIVSWPRRAA